MLTQTEAPPVILRPIEAVLAAESTGKSRPRSQHRLWRAFTGVLLIAAMLGSVVAMVTVITQHLAFAPVLSGSMVPTFRPGDLIITKPEPAADVKVGQIIALPVPSSPGQKYVHRVISVTYAKDGRPVVQTKGDANPAPESFKLRIDSPTVPVVIESIPGLGRLSLLLQHTWLRLIIVTITVGAMFLAAWRLLAGLRSGESSSANGRRARHG